MDRPDFFVTGITEASLLVKYTAFTCLEAIINRPFSRSNERLKALASRIDLWLGNMAFSNNTRHLMRASMSIINCTCR